MAGEQPSGDGGAVRTLVVWCPDWPVTAAGIVDGVPVHHPVAVLRANRVVSCSPAARAEGVTVGLRKREAQSRCPHLIVVDHDPAREARAFEPVVDRKSTRLNSSHVKISYAVFCLKKKTRYMR